MRFCLALALAAFGLLAAASAGPAEARPADPILLRDTLVHTIFPLGGDLVYFRAEPGNIPERAWMARFRGRLHRARGIPAPGDATYTLGDIGWDRDGHKVFTFGVGSEPRWFAYDLTRNRTRPLRGLPAGCTVVWAAVWRRSMAYDAICERPEDTGVFVRRGRHTQRVLPYSGGQFMRRVFRAGTLAVLHPGGEENAYVQQWMANGKSCVRTIPASSGDPTLYEGWHPADLWLSHGYLTWTMGHPQARRDFALLAAKVTAGCHTPGPVGLLRFTPQTPKVLALAVDGRRVYYAGGHDLRTHVLPAKPSFDPPRNDDFEDAKEISGDAPQVVTGRLAYATVQPGEPLARTRHTVWYAWRPKHSGSVNIWGNCTTRRFGNCYGGARFGVYTGSRRDALTEIPPLDSRVAQVDAVAGKTYWIAVGSAYATAEFDPSYEPFTIHIDPPYPGSG